MRQVRMQDVADAAGVSTSTVSNYLHRPGRLKPDTAERIRQAIEAFDYQPHSGAAELRGARRGLIGVVIPDVTNYFYASIVRGVTDVALERGLSVVLCDSGDDPAREIALFDQLSERRALGAVVVPLSADHERLQRLIRRGIQVVVADRASATSTGCSVGVDDVRGGRIAVEHLVAGGARDIAVINGAWSIKQCADRFQGAVGAAGKDASVRVRQVEVSAMTVEQGAAAATSLLADLPDALFCTNDFLAAGAVQALLAAGIEVPGQVRVVGYGDLELASLAQVPLTTISQPVAELGRLALELLVADVNHGAEHQHAVSILEPALVVRESAPS
ncbi:LacI family DNA-binding transcriptional regulator [Occultella gossypii]|uniref:LacI family DNA-binding transcriptional regulator n=1 Tax=Occultella gossypii TaxID=2800820 RepID=A0ABS7SGQ0_9MICO|nr:LacI family DNA-binding transcriptional regulator [Occultella gossypii]MBZ2199529.1 LacI family DNA-binding transcriptional regulator [Occultella gossypii]